MNGQIQINDMKIGAKNPLLLIAGPCVIESEKSTLEHAAALRDIAKHFKIPFIFKSSYDKANRSSIDSYRGPGLAKGLAVLKKVKDSLGVAVLSDVHCKNEIEAAAAVLDVIQIPAFLCRQTDFIIACAKTKKAINIKKGQFLAPWDIINVIKKVRTANNDNILITERGFSFGYNNLVSDMRSIPIMQKFGYPVIYDATHSVQLPGAAGDYSGGEREFILPLAMAAVAAGCDGIFVEAHKAPAEALCDAANTISLEDLKILLEKAIQIRKVIVS
jgi:2-dehydro-3-deoxyphosphooctonate aldolase (KDO 8-P synthase)